MSKIRYCTPKWSFIISEKNLNQFILLYMYNFSAFVYLSQIQELEEDHKDIHH